MAKTTNTKLFKKAWEGEVLMGCQFLNYKNHYKIAKTRKKLA